MCRADRFKPERGPRRATLSRLARFRRYRYVGRPKRAVDGRGGSIIRAQLRLAAWHQEALYPVVRPLTRPHIDHICWGGAAFGSPTIGPRF